MHLRECGQPQFMHILPPVSTYFLHIILASSPYNKQAISSIARCRQPKASDMKKVVNTWHRGQCDFISLPKQADYNFILTAEP